MSVGDTVKSEFKISDKEYESMSLKKFFIEFRIPDRITIPSESVAIMYLTKAALLR